MHIDQRWKIGLSNSNLLYRIVYTGTWNTNYILYTKVHVNIYRVIGHKTIKTKQKTNALLILETQNFKTSTLATSATMPE